VGSATPYAEELEHYRLSWHLTTGATLIISRPLEDGDDWEHNLEFSLTGSSSDLVRPTELHPSPSRTSVLLL
jgi:hypothetical protein